MVVETVVAFWWVFIAQALTISVLSIRMLVGLLLVVPKTSAQQRNDFLNRPRARAWTLETVVRRSVGVCMVITVID